MKKITDTRKVCLDGTCTALYPPVLVGAHELSPSTSSRARWLRARWS
jgi:hypothetical protein